MVLGYILIYIYIYFFGLIQALRCTLLGGRWDERYLSSLI